MRQQISTSYEVHYEENSFFVLKTINHLDNKGMLSFKKNLSFSRDILDAVMVDELVFTLNFHGENFLVI